MIVDLSTNSKIQLILQVSHRKWKFRDDDLAQVLSPDISTDEEVQVQLMIAWDHKIVTHHRLDTTADVGLQEHDAPSTGVTRKPHDEL
ncbi:hypothetical protein BHE74_00032910 [Ensete ventricosum]|nr:hypothetical protein BHE74_00032910 [Ensete ventricosum]